MRIRLGRRLASVAAAMTVAGLLPVTGTLVPAAAALPPMKQLAPDSRNVDAPVLKAPVLRWEPLPGADEYQLQISPAEDFSDPENIVVDQKVVSPEYTPSTLLPHESYFWRVRALKGTSAVTRWSPGWTFTRGWEDRPTLQPVAGLGRETLQLNWSAVRYASFYEIQISESPTFHDRFPVQTQGSPPVFTCYTNHNSYTPYEELIGGRNVSACSFTLTSGTQYYWRVRAHDGSEDDMGEVSTTPRSSGVSHEAPGTLVPTKLQIASLSRTYGKVGDEVTITGKGFTNRTQVKFGGVPAAAISVNPDGTAIKTTVPSPPTRGFTGVVHVQAFDADDASPLTDADKFRYGDEEPKSSDNALAVTSEAGAWSRTGVFEFWGPGAETMPDYRTLKPPTQVAQIRTAAGDDFRDCSNAECAMTPTLTWDSVSGASSYRVYLGLDRGLSNVQRIYETRLRSLTPSESLFDNQAGKSYYWAVQPCTVEGCGQVPAPEKMPFFRQRALPVVAMTPGDQTAVTSPWVTFRWQPYLDTTGEHAEEARGYRIQVWDNPNEDGKPVDSAVVDHPWYTSPDELYPDGTYYWRIQAIDQSGHALAWSAPNRDTGDTWLFVKDTRTPAVKLAAREGLAPNGPVTVSFSEKMRNVENSTVRLLIAGTGTAVPISVRQSSSGTTASVTPKRPLEPGRAYTVLISGVTDLAGNPVTTTTTTVRVNGTVDSTSPLLGKTGTSVERWFSVNASDAVGRSYVVATHDRRYPSQPFVYTRGYGRTIRLYACKGPQGGQANVALDGKVIASVDLYQRYSACGRLVWSRATNVGSHSLSVYATGYRNAASRATRVGVDAVTFS